MANLVVPDSLKNRREALMWQRRWRRLRACWQFVCLCGLAGGMVWVMSWPEWSVRSAEQVAFQGQRLVASQVLYDYLELDYPQAIWQLSTDRLAEQLATNPAVLNVEVTRKLFPAELIVAIQERQPVAVAVTDYGTGYLDREGNYIPGDLYGPEVRAQLPKAPQFLGFSPQYRSFWRQNYPLIQQSPLNITVINGNNPTNITITTALGLVRLGSGLDRFQEQLTVLEKMQNLPSRVPREKILFIDLTNPAEPSIQLRPEPQPTPENVTKTLQ